MDMQNVLSVLQSVITLIVGGVALYLKFSAKAQTKAKEVQQTIAEITAAAVIYIRDAETKYKDATKSGGKKFDYVVYRLYALVPEGLNKIITEDMIKEIVQSTFNEVEEYMKLHLDETIDKI